VANYLFTDPRYADFMRWASVFTEQLANTNISNPVSEEAWASWASQLYDINNLASQGLPHPKGFSNWQAWAMQCSNITG
jgi:hypothetical protein